MLKLLDEKDTPDYWIKRLLSHLLVELGVTSYIIIDEDELRPDDTNVITVQSETTYDKPTMGHGYDDDYIFQYKIYTIRVHSGSDETNGEDDSWVEGRRLFYTLEQLLHQTNWQQFNLQQIIRTSTTKRMGNDLNGNSIYDMRYKMLFIKEKENR